MDKEAREARNAYRREYYRKNKKRIQEQQEAYWHRKGQQMKAEKEDARKEAED